MKKEGIIIIPQVDHDLNYSKKMRRIDIIKRLNITGGVFGVLTLFLWYVGSYYGFVTLGGYITCLACSEAIDRGIF